MAKKLSKHAYDGLAILLAGLSGTPFSATITYYIAGEIRDALSPDTYGLSYISNIYQHKDGPSYGTIYKKYNITWYG